MNIVKDALKPGAGILVVGRAITPPPKYTVRPSLNHKPFKPAHRTLVK